MSDRQESKNSWESNLDSNLVYRLSKPLRKPGLINSRVSKSVFLRNGLMVNKHPLLSRLIKRSGINENIAKNKTPIVYKPQGPKENSAVDGDFNSGPKREIMTIRKKEAPIVKESKKLNSKFNRGEI